MKKEKAVGKICSYKTGEPGERLLVYRGELRKVKFRGRELSGADFRGADLSSADFEGANLNHAVFHGANLYHANFKQANLEDADFSGADCFGANFQDARLDSTDFSRAILIFADFSNADLCSVTFTGSDLTRVCLQGVQTDGADPTLAAWILRNAAGDDPDKRALAGLVLLSDDWCWADFIALRHPAREWAIEILGSIDGFREELIEHGMLKPVQSQ